MDSKSLSIFMNRDHSLNIYHEEVLGVFQNITLQYFSPEKHKIPELTLHIKSHRAILFNNNDKKVYFEIHYNNVKDGIVPIKRGVFRREIYKLQIPYKDNKVYELKYPSRSNFEPVFSVFERTFEKSKTIVSSLGQEYNSSANR
jgi:hypothetical protein